MSDDNVDLLAEQQREIESLRSQLAALREALEETLAECIRTRRDMSEANAGASGFEHPAFAHPEYQNVFQHESARLDALIDKGHSALRAALLSTTKDG